VMRAILSREQEQNDIISINGGRVLEHNLKMIEDIQILIV